MMMMMRRNINVKIDLRVKPFKQDVVDIYVTSHIKLISSMRLLIHYNF